MIEPPPRRPPPGPRDSSDLFSTLAARQDAGIERLTHAVAKVLSESAQAQSAGRAAELEAIRASVIEAVRSAGLAAAGSGGPSVDPAASAALAELTDLVRSLQASEAARSGAATSDGAALRAELAALRDAQQAEARARAGAAASDAEALRTALASGFAAVDRRLTEALQAEVTRLATAWSPPERPGPPEEPGATAASISALQDAAREQAATTAKLVDAGFASIRSTLADAARAASEEAAAASPLRDDLAAVGQTMREDLRAVVEALRTDLAALRASVGSSDGSGRARTEEQLERLRAELVASLGALHHALQEPLDAAVTAQEHTVTSLHADLGATVRLLQRGLAESTTATAAAVAAVQRQVDELTATAGGIAAAQDELRALVRQLWGDDSAE